MKPAVVADVGNSRIKWGRCAADAIVETAALPADDPLTWQGQVATCGLAAPQDWAVSGVAPERRDALIEWLVRSGHRVALIDDPAQLPIRVDVERPDAVGVDRLLNAVAANRRRNPRHQAIMIDAGSAVTVDQVTVDGAFSGGSIFPGLRLMARSLHDYTALLPVVEVTEPGPLPARSTMAAMRAGVFWAVVGGVRALVLELSGGAASTANVDVFLTGGDAGSLHTAVRNALVTTSPKLTLTLWP